jgi:hypothetical protein
MFNGFVLKSWNCRPCRKQTKLLWNLEIGASKLYCRVMWIKSSNDTINISKDDIITHDSLNIVYVSSDAYSSSRVERSRKPRVFAEIKGRLSWLLCQLVSLRLLPRKFKCESRRGRWLRLNGIRQNRSTWLRPNGLRQNGLRQNTK